MSKKQDETIDYEHPVAYDAEGRPLYAHPPSQSVKTTHITRSLSPEAPVISDAIKLKHDKSIKLYPNLNIGAGEYVVLAVRRHLIGLLPSFIGGVLLIALAFSLLFNYDLLSNALGLTGAAASLSVIFLPVMLFVIMIVIVVYVTYFIFTNNRMFLTNESIFQTIQVGLFTKREQMISLENVEDASYTLNGVVEHMFNYGSIRLSTIGDEQSYRLTFVANPKQQVDILNNAIEAFKNGRPVERS